MNLPLSTSGVGGGKKRLKKEDQELMAGFAQYFRDNEEGSKEPRNTLLAKKYKNALLPGKVLELTNRLDNLFRETQAGRDVLAIAAEKFEESGLAISGPAGQKKLGAKKNTDMLLINQSRGDTSYEKKMKAIFVFWDRILIFLWLIFVLDVE